MRMTLPTIAILAFLAAPAGAQTAGCLAEADPARHLACVRAALGSADPDLRSAALMSFVARLGILAIDFDTPQELVEFRSRIAEGKARSGDMPSQLFLVQNFNEDARNRVALVVDGRGADGSLRLTARDKNFSGTKRQADIERESRGVAQITGGVLRAAFAYGASSLSDIAQCTFIGRLAADGERAAIAGSLSCTRFLPATPARIDLY